MTDPLPPEDLNHLPRADEGPADPRAAKAALWKEIAARKKAARPPEAAAPEPAPAPQEPVESWSSPPAASSGQGWNELLSTPLDELHDTFLAPELPAPPPVRRRSVIRSSRPVEAAAAQSALDSGPEPEAPQDGLNPQTPHTSHAEELETTAAAEQEAPAKSPAAEVMKAQDEAAGPAPVSEKNKGKAAADAETSPRDEVSVTAAVGSVMMELLRQKWVQWGGASLSISLAIHLLILSVGGFLVVSQVMLEPEVDFLPGGTKQGQEASQALEHKIQQKKNPWLRKPVPMKKIAAVGSISEVVLPDEVPDLLDLPSSSDFLSASKLGGSAMGGGGFGKGMGLGAKSGMVFQPLSMFGREIKAKKLALVLDVSSSMAPFLPRVIEEVDKVAKGSIIILFPGCGLDSPPPRGISGKEIFRTNGPEFERFWRSGGMSSYDDARKYKFSKNEPIQNESVFNVLSKRPQTYFIHYVGIGYTWLALLSDQVRQADALYWFSDFQDNADFKQVEIVRENLLRRGQRLYIQPYGIGSALDLVRSQLVQPTDGDVIDVQF